MLTGQMKLEAARAMAAGFGRVLMLVSPPSFCYLNGCAVLFRSAFNKKEGGQKMDAGAVIGLVIGLVIFSAVIGIAVEGVVDIDTTDYTGTTLADIIDNILPLMVGISALVLVCKLGGLFILGPAC